MSSPQTLDAAAAEVKRKRGCAFDSEKRTLPHDSRKSNRVMSYIIPPTLWYLRNGHLTTGACLIAFQMLLVVLMGTAFFQIMFSRAGYLPNRSDRDRVAAQDGGETAITSSPDHDTWNKDNQKTYDRRPSKRATMAFMSTRRVEDNPIYLARADTTDGPRYCSICDVEKFDRTHHCSEVNRCIRKFDHFCPWVGGPIGHTRYKFFFQFITYSAFYMVYVTITMGIAVSQRQRALRQTSNFQHIPANPGLWYACIALGGFFALLMVPFSAFHGHQIALNKTTIESVDTRSTQVIVQRQIVDGEGRSRNVRQRVSLDPTVNPFDLDLWRNWQQVMGPVVADRWIVLHLLNWILPIKGSPGDGLNFPYNEELVQDMHRQAAAMLASNPMI